MHGLDLRLNEVQPRIKAAKQKITVIFPNGDALPGWADEVVIMFDGLVKLRGVTFEVSHIVEGIRVGVRYSIYDEMNVIGGMVTWFPLGKDGE